MPDYYTDLIKLASRPRDEDDEPKGRPIKKPSLMPWLAAAGLVGGGALAYKNRDELANLFTRAKDTVGKAVGAKPDKWKSLKGHGVYLGGQLATAGAGALAGRVGTQHAGDQLLPGNKAVLLAEAEKLRGRPLHSANWDYTGKIGPHVLLATDGSYQLNMSKTVGNNTGVLGHELGHTLQNPALAKYQALSQLGGLSSLGGLSDDKRVQWGASLAGSAAMLPTLAHEIDASMRGARLLRGAGVRGNPYLGLFSYGAQTAMPIVGQMARDYYDRK